jgi:hypothetical protein
MLPSGSGEYDSASRFGTMTERAVKDYNTIGLHLGPWLWQSKGASRRRSFSGKLQKQLGTASGVGRFHRAIALMLAGFSVETLLKMVLIDAHFRTVAFPSSYTQLCSRVVEHARRSAGFPD